MGKEHRDAHRDLLVVVQFHYLTSFAFRSFHLRENVASSTWTSVDVAAQTHKNKTKA